MRIVRLEVGAGLLGLAAGLGTVDSLALWGHDAFVRSVWLTLVLAIVALALVGRPTLFTTPNDQPSLRAANLARLALLAWLGWALFGAVAGAARVDALVLWSAFVLIGIGGASVVQHGGWPTAAPLAAMALLTHSLASIAAMVSTDVDPNPGRLQLAALEANQLARPLALLALVAITAVWGRNERRDPFRRLAWAAVALVSLGSLVLTESRTASLAVGVAVALWLLVARQYRSLMVFVAIGACLIAGVVATGESHRIIDRLSRGDSTASEVRSLTGRTTLWPLVLDEAKAHPVIGIGVGRDRQSMVQAAEAADLSWSPQHAHNLGLHVLLISGFPGVLLFATAGALALWSSLMRREATAAAVLALIVIDGVSEAVVATPNLAWVLIGCAVGALGAAGSTPDDPIDATAGRPNDGLTVTEPGRRLPSGWPALAAVSGLAVAVGLATLAPFGYPFRWRCPEPKPLDNGALLQVSSAGIEFDGALTPLDAPLISEGWVDLSAGPIEIEQASQTLRCAAQIHNGLTLEATVRTNSLDQTGPARLFTISDGTEWYDIDFQVGQDGPGLAVRVRRDPDNRVDTVVDGVFADTVEFHHLAVAFTDDAAQVFVDGELRRTIDLDGSQFSSWQIQRRVLLGAEASGDRPFDGAIGHLRIWPGALPPDRLGELAERGP